MNDTKSIELSNKAKVIIKKHPSDLPRVQLFQENGDQLTQPVAFPRFRKNIYQKLCAMNITKQEVIKTLGTIDSITNAMVLKK
ncbi:hypothetical protein [uncultured Clostridium sp.]|jgi:hypothetical protein|uniref:hypothetical protein n=1 Tax=uncultured Clostridium sp. TaxID=59620 RepID=UPI002624650F|nr:hypothetical protein [uncultured Clostridium sp.]